MAQEEKNIITAPEDFERDIKAESEQEKTVYNGKKKGHSRRTRRLIVGGVFSLLAIVGVITIINGFVNAGKKMLDNTDEKQAYSQLLSTIVIYDPLPFESPEEADQEILLTSSVWAAIMNEDMTVYEKDEYDQTLLPAVVVDKYFSAIFGTEYKLEHHTFTKDDAEFVFDSDKQVYAVPITSYPSGYTPDVVKIKNSHGERILTVAYLAPLTSWADTGDRTVSKYVDYVFEKQDGNYCLKAIRESDMKVEVQEVNSDSQNTQQ